MDEEEPTRESPRVAWGWHVAWVVVFTANLPLSLMFGFAILDESGYFGMFVAIVAMWQLGHLAIHHIEDLAIILIPGSIGTALLQFVGIVHIFAGVFGLIIAARLDPSSAGRHLSGVSGFWATIFTGALLIVVALLCGFVFRAVYLGFVGCGNREPNEPF